MKKKNYSLLFIFITIFIDITGLGIIIPIIPSLISELIDGSILNSRYGKYPIFSLFIGLLYKLGSFLQVTDLLLFFKMSVVLLGSLIPATISSILNLLNIRFKISSFIYYNRVYLFKFPFPISDSVVQRFFVFRVN